MNAPLSARLRAQCDGPRDGALLRFSLGNALLSEGDAAAAVVELRRAVEFDAHYSAAWKWLGKACMANADPVGADVVWQRGIEVARQRGDKQAEKEMTVFLRRLNKAKS